jgi:2-C-methyl-D-erythritol 4-phosphate cytidylyltransferase
MAGVTPPSFAAILVMAGTGSRFGGPVPKVYAPLAGEPLWRHAARTLSTTPGCVRLVLVVAEDRVDAVAEAAADLPLARVTAGGERRQDSVRQGLGAVDVPADVVAVHDAARPLIRADVVTAAVATAAERGAALVAVPVSDTIKQVDAGGVVAATPDRSRLWRAQTPQCFRLDVLLRAHEQALRDGVGATDDAALVELMGHPVPVVRGDTWNLKVTEPDDLAVAEALLARRAQGGAP